MENDTGFHRSKTKQINHGSSTNDVDMQDVLPVKCDWLDEENWQMKYKNYSITAGKDIGSLLYSLPMKKCSLSF